MRRIYSIQRISIKTLDSIIEGGDRAEAGWTGELTKFASSKYGPKYNIAKDTATPQVQKISIPTYVLYTQPQISQRL